MVYSTNRNLVPLILVAIILLLFIVTVIIGNCISTELNPLLTYKQRCESFGGHVYRDFNDKLFCKGSKLREIK